MTVSEAWLIANPMAGRKAGFTVNSAGPEQACAALERHGLRCHSMLTERAGHATELAHQALAAGARLVVAAGGDGTVHEVAEALIGHDVPMAIMPLGSLLNLGRAFNVPRDLDAAARIAAEQRIVRMDIGRASTAMGSRLFLEGAGVGFEAGLFAYGNRIDAGRRRAIRLLWRFVTRYSPRSLVLTVDGQSEEVRRAFMVGIAITPYIGLALNAAPEAKIDDRQFDVVVRQGATWRQLFRHVLALAVGWPHDPTTRLLRGRVVQIEGLRRQLMVHADGELLGRTPARFELLPGALPVVVGETPPGVVSAVAGPVDPAA
ncbi:MAG TPA: diacylglycerol kinase family protein [Chloroflexota bacterium]|jgi:diacylglycerol kinase family enzyme